VNPPLPLGSDMLTPEAIKVLRRACKDKKTRRAAVRDPRGLLIHHGIELGADVDLRLYERKHAGDGVKHTAEPVFERNLPQFGDLRQIPPGLDTWWRSTHGGCPYGTVPYTTTTKASHCDIWGVALGPPNWVQDVPGTEFGHWDHPNSQSVCLLSHEEDVEMTECLPSYTISKK
jgi:hypothetical protein